MPEVIIKTRDEWFPADKAESTGGSERRHTEKQALTLAIARKLPSIVADIFLEQFDEALKESEVVFDIIKFHALCSGNQPDIAITISPARKKAREVKKHDFVARIRVRVLAYINGVIHPSIKEDFPSIDIMVKFVNEAGEAVDGNGSVTSTW